MSSPREIADERLANGEIDLDEHTRLIELLESTEEPFKVVNAEPEQPLKTSAKTRIETPPSSREVIPTLPEQNHAWLWWMLGGIGVFIWLAVINSTESTDGLTGSQEGLTIGQLSHKSSSRGGSSVSLTLANTSGRVGDVILYVSHDDIGRKCEHIIEMWPGRIDRVKLDCTIPAVVRIKFTSAGLAHLPGLLPLPNEYL